jgi:uncharacterized protein (DUF1800 family)
MRNRKHCVLLAGAALGLAAAASAVESKARPGAWTSQQAAHLLRRAGFGGTPDQVEYLTGLGRLRAVETLVNYDRIAVPTDKPPVERAGMPDRDDLRGLTEEERQKVRMERMQREQVQLHLLRRWWVQRMVETPRPLEEKMTLFWHGHFTSGAREVKSAWLLWRQNDLFRRNAVGNFRTLLFEVSKDPAMLLYLDNARNVNRKPNENYARELMELFTMGIGHYGERDIQEAARAFTGWSIDRDTGEFVFRPRLHDYGPKTVLGVTGNLNGGDVIDIILQRPETAEFIVRKLWSFFAGDEPPRSVLRSLTTTFRKSNYEIKPLLRAMFLNSAFYSDAVMYAHVKSPVELLVGQLRALEVAPIDLDGMLLGLRLMGQDLFQPPNVKGWDGGLAWINTATLYNRYNVTGRLISGTGGPGRRPGARMMMRFAGDDPALREHAIPTEAQPPFDPMPIIERFGLDSPDAVADHFVDRLIGRPLSDERRRILLDVFERRLPDPGNISSPRNADAIRELILLILATPEYQLS